MGLFVSACVSGEAVEDSLLLVWIIKEASVPLCLFLTALAGSQNVATSNIMLMIACILLMLLGEVVG